MLLSSFPRHDQGLTLQAARLCYLFLQVLTISLTFPSFSAALPAANTTSNETAVSDAGHGQTDASALFFQQLKSARQWIDEFGTHSEMILFTAHNHLLDDSDDISDFKDFTVSGIVVNARRGRAYSVRGANQENNRTWDEVDSQAIPEVTRYRYKLFDDIDVAKTHSDPWMAMRLIENNQHRPAGLQLGPWQSYWVERRSTPQPDIYYVFSASWYTVRIGMKHGLIAYEGYQGEALNVTMTDSPASSSTNMANITTSASNTTGKIFDAPGITNVTSLTGTNRELPVEQAVQTS